MLTKRYLAVKIPRNFNGFVPSKVITIRGVQTGLVVFTKARMPIRRGK